jgi:serine/threonine protein kinase
MGIVYAAYDPQLDRKVAIKMMRPSGAASTAEQRERVRREAKAMARLTHPNVVAFHGILMTDAHLCVVMEFVRGTTLSRWLTREPRSWREVVDVFRAAGRGLAAAHGVGLVHRDFKPDNVLIDESGRALVTDFGLACPVDAGGSAADAAKSSFTHGGTPAYMAPEQLGGGAIDPRSDVFSFSVALYEALYKERPFAGDTVGELRRAIRAGRVREPPRDTAVPAWVRMVVLHGMEAERSKRPASMPAILAALARDPAKLRLRVAFTALAVAAGVLLLLFGRSLAPAHVFDDARRAALGALDAVRAWLAAR